MLYNVYFVAGTQVLADIACLFFCLIAIFKNQQYRKFFITNAIAFCILAIGDIYYNYMYRISDANILHSLNFIVTISLLTFQISQAYNWYQLARSKKNKIFSLYNFPYLFLTVLLMAVFSYYFLTSKSTTAYITWNQSISVGVDMIAWFFAIICLAGSRSVSVTLLTFGCLILISGDLSSRCLFMLDATALTKVHWIHVVRSFGAICMAVGFGVSLKNKEFKFCPPNSIQENCCTWLSITSLVVFMIGFLFLSVLSLTYKVTDIRLTLWNLPIALVFTMVNAVLFGNRFSRILLIPVTNILRRIEEFNSGKRVDAEDKSLTRVYEFKMLGDFVNTSFVKLSTQLDRELKLAAQVSHDIRSPLSALQILTEQRLSELPESKRILLRDAVYQIRDIINNLDQHAFQKKKSTTQLVSLLEHVLSECRVTFSSNSMVINEFIPMESYGFFVNVVLSEMKRIITNIVNNAAEAIDAKNGIINVRIDRQGEMVVISVEDNGSGIPKDVLQSIFVRGFTTKKSGSGLGLFHAKEVIEQIGGSIEIFSEEGKGTTVYLKMPSCDPPDWFVDQLKISENSSVVCVDDSISIWNAWQERFMSIKGNIELKYCANKEELLLHLSKQRNQEKQCSYLVDYEFSGKDYTGLHLIEKILSYKKPNDQVYLVTSRSNEADVQSFCSRKKTPIIPKFFALKIPLMISE